MASEGPGVSSKDQADDGTHQTPTPLIPTPGPPLEEGVLADPSGEDMLKATAGKSLPQFYTQ